MKEGEMAEKDDKAQVQEATEVVEANVKVTEAAERVNQGDKPK